MNETSLDQLGPVDYIVVEFPAGASNFTAIDVLILTKDADGSVEAIELSDVPELGLPRAVECRESRCHRRTGCKDGGGGSRRHPWALSSREDSGRGCGDYFGTRAAAANLKPWAQSAEEPKRGLS